MPEFKVKTRHFRRYYAPTSVFPFFEIKVAPMSEIRSNNIDRSNLLPTGGYTQVALYKGDQKIAEGYADCGKNDSYNRKLGRTIALNRALHSLEK